MSEPDSKPCPKCGRLSPVTMLGEEMVMNMTDGSIYFVNRSFTIACAVCGPSGRYEQKIGHHGTLQEAELKKLFPKKEYKRFKQLLDPEQWRLFSNSVHGKRNPTLEEVEKWKALVQNP